MPRKKLKDANNVSLNITSQIKDTILTDIEIDPVALQYLPSPSEKIIRLNENPDPIGDNIYSPVAGIVNRHTDRVLLKITDTCSVYCRFCFRKEMVGKGAGILSKKEIDTAFNYIATHTEISEIIFSGGDPLTLSNKRLQNLISRLETIDHLKIIRFHTRVPMVNPNRIDTGFINIINQCSKAFYLVLHVNHEQEINAPISGMLDKLSRTPAVLLSQSVLLKNINDNITALENLFRALINNRVKPYYLHHPDLAPGTGHFRVSIKKGQQLMSVLRERVSGLCLPTYVLDIPGGFGKIPIDARYIESLDNNAYLLKDHKGQRHTYDDTQASDSSE